MQLACGHLEHTIQLGKEPGDALFFVFDVHALNAQTDDVDGRERDVAASDGGLRSETVFEYTGTASHGSNFMLVAFRVIGFPVLALVEGGVQVQDCLLYTSGVAIIVFSVFSHDALDACCNCIICTFNRVPKEGEYLYNRYLPVISMVWVAFLILLVYVVRYCMNKRR